MRGKKFLKYYFCELKIEGQWCKYEKGRDESFDLKKKKKEEFFDLKPWNKTKQCFIGFFFVKTARPRPNFGKAMLLHR